MPDSPTANSDIAATVVAGATKLKPVLAQYTMTAATDAVTAATDAVTAAMLSGLATTIASAAAFTYAVVSDNRSERLLWTRPSDATWAVAVSRGRAPGPHGGIGADCNYNAHCCRSYGLTRLAG